jgi:hypothetical protein
VGDSQGLELDILVLENGLRVPPVVKDSGTHRRPPNHEGTAPLEQGQDDGREEK